MRPYHPPRPNRAPPLLPRPGDPGPPPLAAVPVHPQLNPAPFPPPVPNLSAAAATMAAAAAANPFLALQLFGQAQQLQNLGFLAAAALQPQPPPFFPGGIPPNPSQFGAFPRPHAGGYGGGGAFRPPGGVGLGAPRPTQPLMGAAGKNCNSGSGCGVGSGAQRPTLNVVGQDRNSSGGEVNHADNKPEPNGISHFASENGGRKSNPGRDVRNGRQFGPSGGRGKGRSFNQGHGRGSNSWRYAKPNFISSGSPASGARRNDSPASGGHRKRPPIIYDANEVKQWLEARKKNYPTAININKKLSQSQPDGEKKDGEAQIRRQELKEVLAKQKELGFELPELPPGYLSETEDQAYERKGKWKTQQRDCRLGKHANKGQRFERRDFRSKRPRMQNHHNHDHRDVQCKRPRVQNHHHHDDSAILKSREPTLLKKLLSSDIKRDRHRLLHTFKFMVLNNFFSDWPDKPVEFPSVKVNQIELESSMAAEDLDDLQNAETSKGNRDFEENDDQNDPSLCVRESGSSGDDEDDGYDDAGASSERCDKNGDEDAAAEQCKVSEEEFSA